MSSDSAAIFGEIGFWLGYALASAVFPCLIFENKEQGNCQAIIRNLEVIVVSAGCRVKIWAGEPGRKEV